MVSRGQEALAAGALLVELLEELVEDSDFALLDEDELSDFAVLFSELPPPVLVLVERLSVR
ncbi:hypothetical protein GC106_80170 [Kibdelosporangium sp. 4NS15]|uniref:Uncharacterized protein n=1 Tax=Kibdelosporangium persicum TaxID=2698649 RepID=A0ABX2FIV0_9PSEU|nr:hypothetical protein [Kibdelosporangium persicum]